MDKQTLNTVSMLVALEAIDPASEGEDFNDYVSRVYPEFEEFVLGSDNSVISEIESDSEDALRNAISKLEVRRVIVQRYCAVNDKFDIEPPKEATDQEILDHNGVEGTVDELKQIMGKSAFADYLKRLKTPKKDGLTQTEINEKREQHYAQYEPVFPAQKSYSHGNGGTTRKYHWEKDLQGEFLEDHQAFLDAFDLSDSFPVIEEDEPESEEQGEPAESDA